MVSPWWWRCRLWFKTFTGWSVVVYTIIHVPHVSKFQSANKMPTISVCYALQRVPENINIKKKYFTTNHGFVSVQYTKNTGISDMFFITHQTETSVSATALYFYMQKPNILQFRYFVFFCFFLIPLGRCLCLIDC